MFLLEGNQPTCVGNATPPRSLEHKKLFPVPPSGHDMMKSTEDAMAPDSSSETAEKMKALARHLHTRPSQPLASRSDTIHAMRALMGTASEESNVLSRPSLTNVYGNGPLLLSDLHESHREDGVIVGIDEAGRGSVCGPMIYGAAFWNPSLQHDKIPVDFNDSKQLTEEKRSTLLEKILETPEIGFGVRVLHASEISRNMLR